MGREIRGKKGKGYGNVCVHLFGLGHLVDELKSFVLEELGGGAAHSRLV